MTSAVRYLIVVLAVLFAHVSYGSEYGRAFDQGDDIPDAPVVVIDVNPPPPDPPTDPVPTGS